jgi:hypothetical protein
MRDLLNLCLLVSFICAVQNTPAKFNPGPAKVPPPQGNIVGNTITKNVGQEVIESLGIATLCGGDKFIVSNGGPVLHWESQWEFGFMFGKENREIFGRHTYAKAGTYIVNIRIDAMCKGQYEGYHDVVAGTATVKVN